MTDYLILSGVIALFALCFIRTSWKSGWIVRCVMYDKAKYICKLLTQSTILPRTSDPTHIYGYRHGLENKTTLLHCYIASVLNTNLLSATNHKYSRDAN